MSDRAPSRAVAAVLAFFLPPGVGHAYVGLPRRGAAWLGLSALVVLGVSALTPAIGALLGNGLAYVLLLAALAFPWLGPFIDVLTLRRARFGPTRTAALLALLVGGLVVSVLARFAARVFFIEAFKIPAGSMMPTLLVGDHIFVDKLVYRRRAPRYGEVMVFAFPEHPEQDFIKRVIALPGDRLEAKNGHPILNGWEVPSCRVGAWAYDDHDSPVTRHEGDLYVEFLGDQAYLTFYDGGGILAGGAQGPYSARPGEYWVMGDNRNNSHDSRMWFGGAGGGVPRDLLRGRALFMWLSEGAAGLDYGRIGQAVEGTALPRRAESLQPALDACLKSRPPLAQTTPPPAMR
jgi:signal peptidase I